MVFPPQPPATSFAVISPPYWSNQALTSNSPIVSLFMTFHFGPRVPEMSKVYRARVVPVRDVLIVMHYLLGGERRVSRPRQLLQDPSSSSPARRSSFLLRKGTACCSLTKKE